MADRDSGCTFLHIDMDAFYASVEIRDRPQLQGLPVIVGGSSARGVVLAATYEARAHGVRSGMPMTRARRLSPYATVLPPDMARYAAVSANVMEIFRSVTPLVEPLSLDEAFLDVSGSLRLLGSPATIARLVRARVADEQGITCSVGVAPVKFVSKIASAACKPDGMLVVPVGEVVPFLLPLPVSALWGVGTKTEETLHKLGLRTVGDIARTPEPTLRRALGNAAGTHLAALARGEDPRRVSPEEPERSIGAEETFERDVDDPDVVHREILRLSRKVAARLRSTGTRGRTITLKVRFSDFTTITRSRSLPEPTDLTPDVAAAAWEAYLGLGLQRARLRLVGVRVEKLVPAGEVSHQLSLDERERGWREAEVAGDKVARRFGRDALAPATLLRATRVPPAGGTTGSRDP